MTDTTHITKDQSEARKAEVPETEALKPCPFCGGKCDPEGWIGDKKRSGPACDDCGSAAETVAIWNTRAAELEQSQPAQISHHEDCWRDPKHHACAVAKIEQSQSAGNAGEVAWNFLGWARYDEGGFPHFCDDHDAYASEYEFAFRVYAVNPAPSVSAQDASPKDGWKLVPLEPTQEMLMAGAKAGCSTEVLLDDTPFSCDMACWKAMLATSPEPPTCK